MEALSFNNIIISHITSSRKLDIEKLTCEIDINKIKTNKDKFFKLCASGCTNFNSKYSCPPHSPSFEIFSKNYNKIFLICYKINLDQYSEISPYNGIRASNSILKSILDRELLHYKLKGFKVVGSGSCRACKPCGAKLNIKCKKPDRIIFSLESLGVDVCHLIKNTFNLELEWYKKWNNIKYTCVAGGILKEN